MSPTSPSRARTFAVVVRFLLTVLTLGGPRVRRRSIASLVVHAVLATGLVAGAVAIPAAPARAAAGLDCSAIYTLGGAAQSGSTHSLQRVSNGSTTLVQYFGVDNGYDLNGLGITADGSAAVFLEWGASSIVLYKYDAVSKALDKISGSLPYVQATHAAISPKGVYYYGGVTSGAQLSVYGFDIASRTYLGRVAHGTFPSPTSESLNGDWAFGRNGEFYVVGGTSTNVLAVANQQLPTKSGSDISLSFTELTRVSRSASINSLAIGADGYVYGGSSAELLKFDGATGAATKVGSLPGDTTDAASCAFPTSVEVHKSFPNGRADAGDQVTLSVTGGGVSSGNTAVTSGSASGLQPVVAGPVIVLPGSTMTVSESGSGADSKKYDISWACVDTGSGSKLAGGSGTSGSFTIPSGASGLAVSCTFTNAAVPRVPKLNIAKQAVLAAGAAGKAGDTVNYTFTASNTGDLPLTGVAITDPLVGLSALSYQWPGAVGALAVGQSVTATASYVLKQSDVDAGSVANQASATGRDPSNALVDGGKAPATVVLNPRSSLAITKSGALAAGATGRAGDSVQWSFTATNTGDTTLSNVLIGDQKPGLSALSYVWPGAVGVLAPGQKVTATASSALTQAEVDAGVSSNVATLSGRNPKGVTVDGGQASAQVPLTGSPSLGLTKVAQLAAGMTGKAGDTVKYSFVATNTGNQTLSSVSVTDQLAGMGALSYAWPGAAGVLSPGQSVTATASYVLKQADVDAGSVNNVATAQGRDPKNVAVPSSPAQATVPLSVPSKLDLVKTAALAAGAAGKAGDAVNYTFTATNSGQSTLHDVTISDQLAGLSALSYAWPGVPGTLSPGQKVTATATYTVRQADVDAGSVANQAGAHGVTPQGAGVDSPKAPATVPLSQATKLDLAKTAALAAGASGKAGDTVNYTFTATNSGAVTLKNVTIADQLAGLSAVTYAWPGTPGTLSPGQKVTATATYVVKQADVDAGSVANQAGAHGVTPQGAGVDSPKAPATVPLSTVSKLDLVKTAALAAGASGKAGDTVNYTFTATNSGAVTLTNVTISDQLAGLSSISYTWPGAVGVLAPGQKVTATATYTVKQGDVDAGAVANQAGAHGTTPSGAGVDSPKAPATVPLSQTAKLDLAKTAALAAGAAGKAGDTVNYTFTATNSGAVTLNNVTISDQLAGLSAVSYAWPGAPGMLAPGQKVTATATYPVKQADVDAGAVANQAGAHGTTPSGAGVDSPKAPATVPLSQVAKLDLAKSAALAAGAAGKAGDTVNYTFTATNSGAVTLKNVTIADQLAGLSSISYTWPGTPGTLAPGQKVTATATYTVKQADVDAGAVANQAAAHGTTPSGAGVDSPKAPATVPLSQAAKLDLVKTAALAAGAAGKAGDTVQYTFTATNSGAVTVKNVTIADQLAGLSAVTYAWPGTPGTLAPGQKVTATATYTVKQADVDAGSVANQAAAHGTTPSGAGVDSPKAPATVPLTPAPKLDLTKTAALAAGATGKAGDTVQYTFTATNSGAVTVKNVTIADQLAGLSAVTYTWPGTPGTLAPGQQVTATATYTVKQADVDAGAVANQAAAHGVTPAGVGVDSPKAPATVPLSQVAKLDLVKTAALAAGASGKAGDAVQYTFTATNSGAVTLTGVSVADRLVGLSVLSYAWPGAPGTLSPGQRVTATATYTVTQADVDAGSVANEAGAHGSTPSGVGVDSPKAQATVPLSQASKLDLSKSAALAVGAAGKAGDTVQYTFTATNSGAVTLKNVTVADLLVGLSPLSYTWPGAPGMLSPGQTVTATATYTVKQADVDAGAVANQAAAHGTTPAGVGVDSPKAPATVPLSQVAKLDLVKTAALTVGATGKAGDSIRYTFTVTNSGAVTVSGVTVSDRLPGLSGLLYAWPGVPGVLAPGQSVTATASYVIVQADVDAGSVANRAGAHGTTPSGAGVDSPEAAATVPLMPAPKLDLTKTAVLAGGAAGKAGDTVSYTFTATNSGAVTLKTVTISDQLAGLSSISYAWPGAVGVLSPGQRVTATATYAVTQADVDAGAVANQAFAHGVTPQGAGVDSPKTPATVPLSQVAALELTKTAALAAGAAGRAGDVIQYTFTATNSGVVTVKNVTVADQLAGLSSISYTWPGVVGTLAPGQKVTATATYTVRQADMDAGAVANQAAAHGTTPSGAGVDSPKAPATVALTQSPRLTLVKTAALVAGAAGVAGDTISYLFTVANAGNVTVTGVTVTDPLPGLSTLAYSWPGAAGVLLPGQQVMVTGRYTVTQADVDAGSVANLATAHGADPAGHPVVSNPGAGTVPLRVQPRLELVKTVTLAAGADARAGARVEYSFTATNTGTVTLSNVSISDRLVGLSVIRYTWPATPGVLTPGQQVSATAGYVLTQADVDAGSVMNLAISHGTDPTGGGVDSPEVLAVLPLAPAPKLTLTKTGVLAAGGTGRAGDLVQFGFTISNRGTVTLSGVSISDRLAGVSDLVYVWPGTAGVLAPGQDATATATYLLTQRDVDAGSVTNVATADAVTPKGVPVPSGPAEAVVPVVPAPELQLVKTGVLAPGATGKAGDAVRYTFTATNTGTVTLSGVSITDQLPGLSGLSYTWPGVAGVLAPGQQVSATAGYVLTQQDVDAGQVKNIATAAGTAPNGAGVPSVPAEAVVPIPADPRLDLVKSAALAGGAIARAGSMVEYVFTATNTGTVTLSNVSIRDRLPGLSVLAYSWPATPGVLSPGQQVRASASYVLTQADVDAGSLMNLATGHGTDPTGGGVDSPEAPAVVPLAADPRLELTKTAALTPGATSRAGDTVAYTFTATNTGTVTLTQVSISDRLPGLSTIRYSWPAAPGVLAPGARVTATATYLLTQADVDSGAVMNLATSHGTDPKGGGVDSPEAPAVVPLVAHPLLELVKTGALAPGGTGRAGDTVQFGFTITNTGTVTISGVLILDQLPGLSVIGYTWPGAVGVLAPGQQATATATYQLTQPDVDAGRVRNVATAFGKTPKGADVPANPAEAVVEVAPQPKLELVKTGMLAPGAAGKAGETVQYAFTATNTGTVTLSGVAITDALPGLSTIGYTWPGTPGVLAPGQTVPATATYQLTQQDVDAGQVVNTATAAGTAPDGSDVPSAPAQAMVPIPADPRLTLTKTATLTDGAIGKAGDSVQYSFTAVNTGTVTLTGVVISDQLTGMTPLTYTWPAAPGTLAPGEVVTASAGYILTQDDVDSGSVANRATVSATDPHGNPVDGNPAQAVVPLIPQPGLSIVKTAALHPGAAGRAGDQVDYGFTLTNTGTVTLTGVRVTDVLAGLSTPVYVWPGTAGILAPGQTATATAEYQLTQADVDAGAVMNSATGDGTAPDGTPVGSGPSDAVVPITPQPGLLVSKQGTLTAGAAGQAGDLVEYTFTAANTGTVTLTGVSITDQLTGLSALSYTWPDAPGVLTPGQVVTATASYRLTQDDVDAGAVMNTATGDSTAPNGDPVPAGPADAVVPITPTPGLTLVKQAALVDVKDGDAGSTVNYTFAATNTGNLTLTGVVITDQLTGLTGLEYQWPATPGVLTPGQTVTARATYTITDTDVTAGAISNHATATGSAPDGTPVPSDPAEVTLPLPARSMPGLSVTKAGALAPGHSGRVGDRIDYQITVTNTGNIPLTGIRITDPLEGISPLRYNGWPGTPGTLNPGETVIATATYTITLTDTSRGYVDNTAWATGTGPKGQNINGQSNTIHTPLHPEPEVLAHTGTDLQPLSLAALTLLTGGLLLLLLRNRRRTPQKNQET